MKRKIVNQESVDYKMERGTLPMTKYEATMLVLNVVIAANAIAMLADRL